jgi:hypothetical protein
MRVDDDILASPARLEHRYNIKDHAMYGSRPNDYEVNCQWGGGQLVDEDNHYRNRVLCRVSKTLGKGYFTLGKGFAETLGKEHSAKISSAKGSLPSAFFRTLGKDFAECQKALGKEKHSAN